jgi:hypothetical protein
VFALTLAQALGAMGSGLAGMPNFAAQSLQNAINRDIDAQKFAYETKKDKVANDRSLYAMALERTGDRRLAVLQAKDAQLAVADQHLKVLLGTMSPQEAALRGQQVQAGLDGLRLKNKEEADKLLWEQGYKRASIQAELVKTKVSSGLEKMKQIKMAAAGLPTALPLTHVEYARGRFRLPEEKKAVDDITQTNTTYQQVHDLLKSLVPIYEKYQDPMSKMTNKLNEDPAITEARSQWGQLVLKYKETVHGGTFDAGLEKIANQIFPSATTLGVDTVAGLKSAIRENQKTAETALGQYGIRPTYARDTDRPEPLSPPSIDKNKRKGLKF